MSNISIDPGDVPFPASSRTDLSVAEFDSLMERAISPLSASASAGLFTGKITGFSSEGRPLVECPLRLPQKAFLAASLVPLNHTHLGQSVALMCANGDQSRPVIMGLLTIDPAAASKPLDALQAQVRVDGKSITFSATDEIVFQCGAASMVLTRAGKILIRGAYVSSCSTGVNRVKGGSVQIN